MLIEVGKANEHLNVSYLHWFRPILHRFDLFIFHPNFLGRNNVAQKTNFILMKSTFLQVGKKPVPPQNIQHLPHSLYMTLTRILSIDENII